MQFVKLTGVGGAVVIPVNDVGPIAGRADGGSAVYHHGSGAPFHVQESVDEVLAKIAEATKVPDGAWSSQPKAMPENVSVYWEGHTAETWYRRSATMEAERDAARKALDFQVAERQKLESQLAAWRKAANTDPTDGESDEVLEFLTPGDLAERITGLYRWATVAEKHGTEASREVAELKARLAATEKQRDDLRGRTPVLDPQRVLATAERVIEGDTKGLAVGTFTRAVYQIALDSLRQVYHSRNTDGIKPYEIQ